MQRKVLGKKLDSHKLQGEMERTKDVRIRRHSRDSFDRIVDGIYGIKSIAEVKDFQKTWRMSSSKQWFVASKQSSPFVKPLKAKEALDASENEKKEEAERTDPKAERSGLVAERVG
jgi:hypothetical protein